MKQNSILDTQRVGDETMEEDEQASAAFLKLFSPLQVQELTRQSKDWFL